MEPAQPSCVSRPKEEPASTRTALPTRSLGNGDNTHVPEATNSGYAPSTGSRSPATSVTISEARRSPSILDSTHALSPSPSPLPYDAYQDGKLASDEKPIPTSAPTQGGQVCR